MIINYEKWVHKEKLDRVIKWNCLKWLLLDNDGEQTWRNFIIVDNIYAILLQISKSLEIFYNCTKCVSFAILFVWFILESCALSCLTILFLHTKHNSSFILETMTIFFHASGHAPTFQAVTPTSLYFYILLSNLRYSF